MIWPDVTQLKTFYDSPLGQMTTQSLRRAVAEFWPEAKGESLTGIGYALPCLRPFLKSADVISAIMPASQGVIHWPKNLPNLTLLSYENALPLREGSQNRIIMLHALEHAQPITLLLNEAHRILTPSGRMLVITPNRRSFWARAEHTPYAQGRPFSRFQLKQLLAQHDFHIVQSQEALFFPPATSRTLLGFAGLIERIGRRFFPHFGGALLVEVEKRLPAHHQGTPIKAGITSAQLATGSALSSKVSTDTY